MALEQQHSSAMQSILTIAERMHQTTNKRYAKVSSIYTLINNIRRAVLCIVFSERKEKQQAKHEQEVADLPDIRNQAEVQQYFLQQIQLGEELVQQGQ